MLVLIQYKGVAPRFLSPVVIDSVKCRELELAGYSNQLHDLCFQVVFFFFFLARSVFKLFLFIFGRKKFVNS